MNNICYIPKSLFGANQVSDLYHLTALARDYEEIVIAFPGTSINDTANTLNVIQTVNKPVWIIPFCEVNAQGKTVAQHRTAFRTAVLNSMADIVTKLTNAGLINSLKGFAFDYLDCEQEWGDPALAVPMSVPTPSNPWHLNKPFINDIIAEVRNYAKPTMLIAQNPGDALGSIYGSANSDFPGSATWPTLLGNDSSKVDWIVLVDPVMTLQRNLINTAAKTPLAFAWHRLGLVAQAKAARSSNLKIGALQSYSFHTMNPDFLMGQFVSKEDELKLQGCASLFNSLGLDAWGFKPLTHPSVPVVISKSLHEGIVDEDYVYPSAGDNISLWSWNGLANVNFQDDEGKIVSRVFNLEFQ